ncbi:MAG: Na+/H+ antiporter subunit E [Acidobacteria bacterium]|nr:Na+/H+ antiporter subunit E [Acidobacteriota bacterium]
MKYLVSLFLLLSMTWLLWSGIWEALTLTLGLVSCIAIVAFVRRMGVVDEEGALVEFALRPVLYIPWLLWEILKANVDVALLILSPTLHISPRVIRVKAGQRTGLGLVVHANSITLTPGTVSIDIEGDTIVIHALTRESAQGVESGVMDRKVTALEGRH